MIIITVTDYDYWLVAFSSTLVASIRCYYHHWFHFSCSSYNTPHIDKLAYQFSFNFTNRKRPFACLVLKNHLTAVKGLIVNLWLINRVLKVIAKSINGPNDWLTICESDQVDRCFLGLDWADRHDAVAVVTAYAQCRRLESLLQLSW